MNVSRHHGRSEYEQYDEWKGWREPFKFTSEDAAYFSAELGGTSLSGLDIFEIGFGGGSFLGWARAAGARVSGSEITPASCRAAEAEGVTLLPDDFERTGLGSSTFDLIVAIDVFEHLDARAIAGKLSAIDHALRPGGRLLLRYPNGQSPFGLAHQHGDATHVSVLSCAKIEQYAARTSLVTERYGGVARPPSRSLSQRLVRGARYALRDLHKRALRFLYATDVEFEPVVTHVLVKKVIDR